MKVIVAGKILEGERDALILQLRRRKLSYRAIGKLVGVSHATVGSVLNALGFTGRLQYRELMNPDTFIKATDSEIANDLKISVDRVARARKTWLGVLEEPGTVSLDARRAFLAKFLFKKAPGPKFGEWLTSCVSNGLLAPKQTSLIKEFYVQGKGGNDDYSRYFRHYARHMLLRRLTDVSVDELVEQEVLL
jgi:hypothetical protein